MICANIALTVKTPISLFKWSLWACALVEWCATATVSFGLLSVCKFVSSSFCSRMIDMITLSGVMGLTIGYADRCLEIIYPDLPQVIGKYVLWRVMGPNPQIVLIIFTTMSTLKKCPRWFKCRSVLHRFPFIIFIPRKLRRIDSNSTMDWLMRSPRRDSSKCFLSH